MNNENLTVHFKVKDFNTWRTSYNGHEKDRVTAGITNGRVFRSPDDPNDVVILQDVADVTKARTWLTFVEISYHYARNQVARGRLADAVGTRHANLNFSIGVVSADDTSAANG